MKINTKTINVFWIPQYVIVTQVWFIEKQKRRFQFCRFLKSSILMKINNTNHMILSTKRRNFSFTFVLSLNLQTSIWNVGRCRFVLQFMVPENSNESRYFTYTEILRKSLCTTARFVMIPVFSNTRFRDPMRKYTQCCAIDRILQCP